MPNDLPGPGEHPNPALYKPPTWAHSIKGRRPFMWLTLQLGEGCNNQALPTPDIINLEGSVGIDRYELKLDKDYAKDFKAVRKQEMLTICDLFLEQVEKSTANVSLLKNMKIRIPDDNDPMSQFSLWAKAIQKRSSFVRLELKLSESPNDQRMPTPDIIYLNGTVGGSHFVIKLDKLYEKEHQAQLKAEMLTIVDLFVGKIKAGIDTCA